MKKIEKNSLFLFTESDTLLLPFYAILFPNGIKETSFPLLFSQYSKNVTQEGIVVTVYLDVIWGLNFMFDTLLLYLTAIVLKRSPSKWRIILGGLLGSTIILLAFTPLHTYSSNPLAKLFFSILMVLTVFGFKRFRYFTTGLMTFYLTTFLVGGSLIGVHYFINFDFQLSNSVFLSSVKGFGDPISWLFVLLGFPIAWYLSKSNFDRIEITKIQYDQLVTVKIVMNDLKIQCKGLVDSGNQLYDPISKLPVMFVSLKNLQDEVEPAIVQLAQNVDSVLFGNETLPQSIEGRMKIIPYKVVGKEHQLIIALKPDEIIIEMEHEKIVTSKGLISFTMQELSSDDSFHCIVHPKLLTGSKSSSSTSKVS
jgi:stage II sporulation protein GA (sporulation sigma-E factor processing peptidase)